MKKNSKRKKSVIDLILESLPLTPISANQLTILIKKSTDENLSIYTVQRYLDIIEKIQNHPIKISLIRSMTGGRVYRYAQRKQD